MEEFMLNIDDVNINTLQQSMNLVLDCINSGELYPQNTNKKTNKPYGCKHFLRRCSIVASCCNKVFPCRFCHNNYTEKNDYHTLNNKDIKYVVCNTCNHKQQSQQYCEQCGTCFSLYYCNICNLFDDVDKGQYHCDKCGICRKSYKENFYHCDGCNACRNIKDKDTHTCLDIKIAQCPICMDDIITPTQNIVHMPCGHAIHMTCFNELIKTNYKCPFCQKTIVDIERFNELMEREVHHTPMPPDLIKQAAILCNDCNQKMTVNFHIVANKCLNCGSYNTRLL